MALLQEVSALCEKLKEIDILLEPGFFERLSKQEKVLFEVFNSQQKLLQHLKEVDAALTRSGELLSELRSQWDASKTLILSLFPLSGALKLEDLERRVVALGRCRNELHYLLEIWTTHSRHSQYALRFFLNQDCDLALAADEQVAIRFWQDIEFCDVRNWVAARAVEFARTHLAEGSASLQDRILADPQLRRKFQTMPRAVSDKVRSEAGNGTLDFRGVAEVVVGVPLAVLFLGAVLWASCGDCLYCGRKHGLFQVDRIIQDPQAMVTVSGGALNPGPVSNNVRRGNWSYTFNETANRDPQLVRSFSIGRYEVTYGEWRKVRKHAINNGYADLGKAGKGRGEKHPVTHVTWYDALKWCNAKSEMEEKTPVYEMGGATFKSGDYGKKGSEVVRQR